MGGTSAISEQEISAFFRNRQIVPAPWEVELLVRLDAVASAQAAEDTT